jgi:hypothetical protein
MSTGSPVVTGRSDSRHFMSWGYTSQPVRMMTVVGQAVARRIWSIQLEHLVAPMSGRSTG